MAEVVRSPVNPPGRKVLAVAALAVALAWPVRAGHADPFHSAPGVNEPPTRFERFVLLGCTPCVTESHPVATLPIRALKLPAFSRGVVGSRPGEVRVEALRAYELGRPSRQLLAMRLTLSVASPTPSGTELYRMAVGLLDEEEVPTLASAITEIANLARASPAAAGAETIDTSFRGGSVRIGLLRFQGETVAYLQAGDLQALALRPVWEVASTTYMPPDELPALASVIDRLAAKVRQLRGL
jgi:hypothetical protein